MARLAFLGTPEVAAHTLSALHQAGHEIVLVVSGADRRRARAAAPTPSPVKQVALDLGLEVSERPEDVVGSGAELGVVVAYGRLVRAAVLDAVPMVNVHFSLLPRWRGAAPVERAILAGDAVTGVAIMALEVTLDTGPIYASEVCAVDPDETADELRARLGVIGTRLLIEQLAHGVSAMAVPVPQTGEATYAAKLTVEDAHLDFHTSALHCHRVVRVGRAWTTFRGNRLVIRRSCVATTRDDAPGAGGAAGTLVPGALPPGTLLPGTLVPGGVMTGDGVLELLEVQAAGRSVQSFDSWILGARLQPGERLGL